MELLPGKEHLKGGEYYWMRQVTIPSKILQNYADASEIVCAVAGTRPLILGETIYGTMPGRAGVISFYKSSDGVYDIARATPSIHYYWDRNPTKKSQTITDLPTMQTRGRPTLDEPWHNWSDDRIARTIVAICEDLQTSTDTIEIVCVAHGINHWGFEAIFQQRWPYEHALWKKYKKIPTRDQLANRRSRRMGVVSIS